MYYFDHASTTPIAESVYDVFTKELLECVGNPSSPHRLGLSSKKKIERAKRTILKEINAEQFFDLYFTSSASESNTWVSSKLVTDHIFYSPADHPSSVYAALAQSERAQIHPLKLTRSGRIDIDDLVSMLNSLEGKKLVMASWINSQTGTSSRLLESSTFLKKNCSDLHLHLDGVQGVCRLPLSLDTTGIDSLTISGHKIGAPQGIAALILRKGISLPSLILGGGQQDGARSSTEPVALISALAAAFELPFFTLSKAFELSESARKIFKESPFNVVFPFEFEQGDSPYLFSCLVKDVPSDLLLRHLELIDIIISSTASCSSKSKKSNPQLEALGLDFSDQKKLIRFSFSPSTTRDDLESLSKGLKRVYEQLSFLIKG